MAIETLGAALRQMNRLLADGTITGFTDAQLLERFISGHDAAAFEALVAHHGSMVLSVCLGILNDPNDAEDAFQATFLILVKKSSTLCSHEALGPWLYRVAYRVAIRANAAAARRRACERRAGQMATTTAPSGPSAPDEQLQALHEEIARLPEKLRRAIILCDLQSAPRDRAARELRLSERTLQRRLSEGHARLKARLIRRGLAPEGAVLESAFLRQARVAVPAAWGQATVRAALATVDHSLTVGVVSAAAKELTQEVLRIMLLQKLTLASASLLAAGLIAWGAAASMVTLQEEPSQKMPAKPNPAQQRKAETTGAKGGPDSLSTAGKVTFRGRVLGPDGQPVPSAKLYRAPVTYELRQPYLSDEYATTGPDGRFEFLAERRARFTVESQTSLYERTVVAAAAPHYGVAWVEVPPEGPSDDVTLQLVNDQPITGQILDLQGKPVPGATLQVLEIRAAAGEDLGPWLDAAKAEQGLSDQLEERYLSSRRTVAPAVKVTADAEGRFRLTGIGRNRLVRCLLDGPTIASQRLKILTRPGQAIAVARFRERRVVTQTYYGASFRHAAAPTKPIFGVVRDMDTKKSLAGITITGQRPNNDPVGSDVIVQTTTDAQGHYRLVGMPKGERNRIKAVPANDEPYLISFREVPDSPGLDPVTADFELKRGIWIEGKLTDKATGKPVVGEMSYHAQPDNPNQNVYGYVPDATPGATSKQDGSYRLAGMPGPGMVVVRFVDGYLGANERDDEFGIKEVFIPTIPMPTINYTAIARIDSAQGVESVKCDLTLDSGGTFTGRVLGLDGRPLAGAWAIGLDSREGPWERHEPMKTAEFTVRRFNPHHPRPILFQHPKNGLVGVAQPPKNKGDSITVQLRPGAIVTGRLVGQNGRARAGVELKVQRQPRGIAQPNEFRYFPQRFKTDQQGRFRIEGLLPGYEFAVSDGKRSLPLGEGLRAGEAKELGDVTIEGMSD